MFKALANDIVEFPDTWIRLEENANSPLIKLQGVGRVRTVKLHLFVKPCQYNIDGHWYDVPWYHVPRLMRAKKKWLKTKRDLIDKTLKNDRLLMDKWIEKREAQLATRR